MKLSRLTFIYFVSIITTIHSYAQDTALLRLDRTLANQPQYDQAKEKHIHALKSELTAATGDALFHLYRQLYKEYEAYICDSAIFYSERLLSYSEKVQNSYWTTEAKLQLASIYSSSGLYHEALSTMSGLTPEKLPREQLAMYYETYVNIYTYLGEYTGNDEYTALKKVYQDSALAILPPGSFNYVVLKAKRLIETSRFNEAEPLLVSFSDSVPKNTRNYAIFSSIMAYLYEQKGEKDKQEACLVQSAIADATASVKENISFRNLATLLLDRKDLSRASRYINKSMEDANFYNARLRNIQTAKIFPVIDKSYQLEKEKQQKKLWLLLLTVSILSCLLILAIIFVIRQNKRLSRARQYLSDANAELKKLNILLSESNHIKEEYIGQFMGLCSSYIDKLEDFRNVIYKKAVSGKFTELTQLLKSSDQVERELNDFYLNFDGAFLKIYPDFVSQFNQLLQESDRVYPKNQNSLTPELRIFALMRLGITDAAKIAGFLRFSITTIYNYRSKYRNKSLLPREEFEKAVLEIGNIAFTDSQSAT